MQELEQQADELKLQVMTQFKQGIEEEKDQLTKQVLFMRSFYSAAEFPIKT